MRWLVVVLAIASASTASADRAKAEAYFRAGSQAFAAQSFAAAAENFELAYRELELPEIAFSAAQSYRRQYFIDPQPAYVKRAVELYRKYLEKVKTGGRVADASDGLAEMQRELDKLTSAGTQIAAIQRAGTRLVVNAVIEGQDRTSLTELSLLPGADKLGAKATIDGKPVKLSDPIEVAAGDHTIEVQADGYFAVTLKKRVAEGDTELAEAVLRPRPGTLVVRTQGGARIAVDGRSASATQDLAAGRHFVAITRRGRKPEVRELSIERGERTTIDVELKPTRQRRAAIYLTVGAGATALICTGTITLALRADGKMADLEDKRQRVGLTADEFDDYRKQTGRRDDMRDAAWGLGITAIATGALAGALFYFDNPSAERAILPVVTTSSAGVAAFTRF